MAVVNMNILPKLGKDFPNQGAVWIWSMDDINEKPYSVIELGRAFPSPGKRVPPTSELLRSQSGDPRFDNQGTNPAGFQIVGTAGQPIERLFAFCISYDERNVETTPKPELQCKPCETEQDCGNGDANTAPDPAKSYCQSPIDTKCPQAGAPNGQLIEVPAFEFRLQARLGYPIKRQSVLRIFLHPLTQWDIGTSCQVAMTKCTSSNAGGECEDGPTCTSEAIVGGPVVGVSEYPVNTLMIILPNIMQDITDQNYNKIKVGNLPLPAGGFFPTPVTAEIMKEGETAPDYWDLNLANGGGALLYKMPKILSAAVVTAMGDGNALPFRGDKANKLYFRIVFGTTFISSGDGVDIEFKLPSGYACDTASLGGTVPSLSVFSNQYPNGKGRLGGRQGEVTYKNVPATPTVMCRLTVLQDMVVYARTVYFVELTVNNPTSALKRDDPNNYWNMSVTHRGFNPPENTIADVQVNNKVLRNCPEAARSKFLCQYDLGLDYGGQVSVLGKLSEFFISPSNFGAGQRNTLLVFFRTEQEVGTVEYVQTEIWVDAPSTFDFGEYCSARDLSSNYYIPEGRGTARIPTGDLVPCIGAPTSSEELMFNRAKITTTGRLLRQTLYGFSVDVTNAPTYIRSQLNNWRLWTYVAGTGSGVDGAYETARFNEQVPAGPDKSWGIYSNAIPPEHFMVSFSSLRPTVTGMEPSSITILPIVVSRPTNKAVRILAPAGYVWDFEQVDFRYQAPAQGVNQLNVVVGAQADMPISGKPARPNSEPKNMITMDYMQSSWTPGVIYGMAAKIRIPLVPPTGSANQFTIEFGYNEILQENRLQAGVTPGPLVQRLINGGVDYTTSIMSLDVDITFSVQTVTPIPAGGALVIIGPASFTFEPFCQPKPATGFPELPYDTTCLYAPLLATGQPEVAIIAGLEGIPGQFYRFSLAAKNPRQATKTGADPGTWYLLSYSLVSERIVLDQNTSVPSYNIAREMVLASLVMWPKVECEFRTLEERQIDPTALETFCDFEYWQFYPPRGFRDDRPLRPSELIFQFMLAQTVDTVQTLLIRAPVGYIFDAECRAVTYPSSRIFNDSAYDGIMPRVPDAVPLDLSPPSAFAVTDSGAKGAERRSQQQRYDDGGWPLLVVTQSCLGSRNEARITLTAGLIKATRYLFRLSVLQNPAVSPEDNSFVLEYNSEASAPFKGINIWAFKNTSVLPTTTAASTRSQITANVVTIMLQPVNAIPFGGHLRITAPGGFIVPTKCEMTVMVHESQRPNASAYPAGNLRAAVLAWSEFLPTDVVCEGDVTASSRGRLQLTRNDKYMKEGILYVITIKVNNPQTTSSVSEMWNFQSYVDLTVNTIIDEASVPGFAVNTAVQAFAYLQPQSANAYIKQRLDFNMSFPDSVEIGDMIQIIAPVLSLQCTSSWTVPSSGEQQHVLEDEPMNQQVTATSSSTHSAHSANVAADRGWPQPVPTYAAEQFAAVELRVQQTREQADSTIAAVRRVQMTAERQVAGFAAARTRAEELSTQAMRRAARAEVSLEAARASAAAAIRAASEAARAETAAAVRAANEASRADAAAAIRAAGEAARAETAAAVRAANEASRADTAAAIRAARKAAQAEAAAAIRLAEEENAAFAADVFCHRSNNACFVPATPMASWNTADAQVLRGRPRLLRPIGFLGKSSVDGSSLVSVPLRC
ncbi:unnamed protein product [Polarella glacialis]|uniref:Uncharacterized protein n=1 Tax=Polarella glacialis TaxID=89957 RepID=A0A813LLH7_POLGL|nr:unnamed protein product [Polarella glacialis]